MILSTILLLFLLCLTANSSVIKVGSGKQFAVPSQALTSAAVQDGDTVEIDAGTYSGDVCSFLKNNILIRGVGGFAHLAAGGKNSGGKAIWVVGGNNNVIEYIEFSDCTVPDQNGAGIRFEGTNLTIRHCNFHDNEDGVLTGANDSSDIVIVQSEFNHNGYGDGQSHNLYIGKVRSLRFRFNYSHHAKIGHNLKSRARENYILYNRIMDEETGNSSMLIDLPNGGKSFIIGNLLMQGPNAENKKLISYGAEGLKNPENVLYIVNNTIVNKRSAGATFVHVEQGTTEAKIINNIFTGPGEVLLGTADTVTNIHFADVTQAGFRNETNYDYQLLFGNPAINAGTDPDSVSGTSLIPFYEYEHPMFYRVRPLHYTIDIGAYEWLPMGVDDNSSLSSLSVYPNPATNYIEINVGAIHELPLQDICIYNILGECVLNLMPARIQIEEGMRIDISKLAEGVYFVKIGNETEMFVKE
ncbi:MAG: T9SS type A sorting domain-containing protein [Bacteroidetes bacterium]|nr:MAG: T9SS type A sorting domain-containing protein [Bacteroidota bacterium]